MSWKSNKTKHNFHAGNGKIFHWPSAFDMYFIHWSGCREKNACKHFSNNVKNELSTSLEQCLSRSKLNGEVYIHNYNFTCIFYFVNLFNAYLCTLPQLWMLWSSLKYQSSKGNKGQNAICTILFLAYGDCDMTWLLLENSQNFQTKWLVAIKFISDKARLEKAESTFKFLKIQMDGFRNVPTYCENLPGVCCSPFFGVRKGNNSFIVFAPTVYILLQGSNYWPKKVYTHQLLYEYGITKSMQCGGKNRLD